MGWSLEQSGLLDAHSHQRSSQSLTLDFITHKKGGHSQTSENIRKLTECQFYTRVEQSNLIKGFTVLLLFAKTVKTWYKSGQRGLHVCLDYFTNERLSTSTQVFSSTLQAALLLLSPCQNTHTLATVKSLLF